MRSRADTLAEKSLAAMISAIEIYNKPDFKYREETFSVLCVNAWELLIKAYWLKQNKNKLKSLYVYEHKNNKDGSASKKNTVKLTRSGNPFTHNMEHLAGKLVDSKDLDAAAWDNLKAIIEIRDSAIHFYNKNGIFAIRLQEVGSASVKNYVTAIKTWFIVDMSIYNFFLMPLSFVTAPQSVDGITLSREEQNIIKYIDKLESAYTSDRPYSVTVNFNITFSKSKVREALNVQLTNDPTATKVIWTEQDIDAKYRYEYADLVAQCRNRYTDFKVNDKFHEARKPLEGNIKYSTIRYLNKANPDKTPSKRYYSESVLTVFDAIYTKK